MIFNPAHNIHLVHELKAGFQQSTGSPECLVPTWDEARRTAEGPVGAIAGG